MYENVISKLLEEATQIVTQHNVQKERTGEGYNIFSVLDMERKEVGTHSLILFSLLSPHGGHGKKDKYLKLFLKEIDIPSPLWEQSWEAEREWVFPDGRIDFLLRCPEMCVAIEMKIDACDQDAQLVRYERYAKSIAPAYRVCYLTLLGSLPSEQSTRGLNKDNLQLLSFSVDIQRWLSACLKETPAFSRAYSFIQQYQCLINKITGEDKMSEQISDLIQDSDHLRGAIEIANALNPIKAKIMQSLFEEIGRESAVLDLHHDFYDDRAESYYSPRSQYIPWLCYKLKEFGPVGKSQKKRAVALSVSVTDCLCAWVELVKISPGGQAWDVMMPEQFGKRLSQKIISVLQPLYGPMQTDGNFLHWFYLYDSKEEKFDFKQFSESCVRLRDEEHLHIEARRIAERMTAEFQRIREALNSMENGF